MLVTDSHANQWRASPSRSRSPPAVVRSPAAPRQPTRAASRRLEAGRSALRWVRAALTAASTGFDHRDVQRHRHGSATGTPIKMTGTDNQNATVGTAVPNAPSVKITDSNNNPVSGVAVVFAVASGGSVTGASGDARDRHRDDRQLDVGTEGRNELFFSPRRRTASRQRSLPPEPPVPSRSCSCCCLVRQRPRRLPAARREHRRANRGRRVHAGHCEARSMQTST